MNNNEQSVKEIKAAIDAWGEALYKKDLEAMHKDHASQYCLYDVQQTVYSAEGSKKLWQGCFPFFDKPKVEYKDMVIHASEDMAIVHFRSRITGTVEPLPEDMDNSWLRGTVGYRKVGGQWKCVHEHISFPVDCEKMTIDFTA
jgi:ketosteroid isomerase-like protein